MHRQSDDALIRYVDLSGAICTLAISRIYLKFSSCLLQRNTANTFWEIKCIHLMNADLFEGEPQCNISLLSTHLFDVCGAPDSKSEPNTKLLTGSGKNKRIMQAYGITLFVCFFLSDVAK